MKELNEKIDKLAEDIYEIKLNLIKFEHNYENSNNILDRLTASVEHHIKRTDELQNLTLEMKLQTTLLKKDLDGSYLAVKFVIGTVAALGSLTLFLKELGILDKLF